MKIANNGQLYVLKPSFHYILAVS